MAYWVYEKWNGNLYSRKMFNNEQDAVDWAMKTDREWRISGQDRTYEVYFGKTRVYTTDSKD